MSYNPIKGNVISVDETGNSTKTLLGASATFTGTFEHVVNYTTLGVAINSTVPTPGTLWIDVSKDQAGTNVFSVPFAVDDSSFELPELWNFVEDYVRIRYVNGAVAQTGVFEITTKYSNGQQLGLAQAAGDTINANTSVQIVKSSNTGANPQGEYVNAPESGVDLNNSTIGTLGNGSIFTGEWSKVDLYAEIKASFNADVTGSNCTMQFSPGTRGTLTFTGQPSNNDTITIGSIVYTFKTAITVAANDVLIGAALTNSIDNIVAAITRTGTSGTDYSEATYKNTQIQLAAKDQGATKLLIGSITAGEIATTETSATASWGAATMLHTIERSIAVPPQANSLQTNFGGVHTLNPILPYYRIVYTNDTTVQGTFSCTTIFGVSSGDGLVSRATQVINRYNDVKLQRVINSPTQDRNFGIIGYQAAKRKFGYNASVPNSTYETVWMGADLGGAGEAQYDWLIAAETVRVLGGNAADDSTGAGARTVTVEGLDENWEFATEDITLAGASPSSATTTTFFRINKMYVKTVGTYAGANTGDIVLEGVTTNTNLAYIAAEIGNTQQAVYSVPANKTVWVTKIKVSVGQGNSASVRMFHNDAVDDFSPSFDSAKHFEWGVEDFSGANEFRFDTFLKFDEKNDIYFDAQRITGSGTAQVSVDFEYIETDN